MGCEKACPSKVPIPAGAVPKRATLCLQVKKPMETVKGNAFAWPCQGAYCSNMPKLALAWTSTWSDRRFQAKPWRLETLEAKTTFWNVLNSKLFWAPGTPCRVQVPIGQCEQDCSNKLELAPHRPHRRRSAPENPCNTSERAVESVAPDPPSTAQVDLEAFWDAKRRSLILQVKF